MDLEAISSFNALSSGETTLRLSYEGKLLPLDVFGAPIAQFRGGDRFLLVLPDDQYEGYLFTLLVLDRDLTLLEQHSAPEQDNTSSVPLPERARKTGRETLELSLGGSSRWKVQLLPTPRFLPREALTRMARGWLPLFEYPRLVNRSYLSIRPA